MLPVVPLNGAFFFFSSLFLTVFSCLVILSKNRLHILSLILAFFNAASLLILLGSKFLAILFIIVYVVAVDILLLFVIMMPNIKVIILTLSIICRYLPISFIFVLIFLLEFLLSYYINLPSSIIRDSDIDLLNCTFTDDETKFAHKIPVHYGDQEIKVVILGQSVSLWNLYVFSLASVVGICIYSVFLC